MEPVFITRAPLGCFRSMLGNNPFELSLSKPALRKLEGPVLSQVEGLNPCPNREDQ